LEWVLDGGGTVTSINASGGTTGLTFSGGPITTSGTLTLSGTLAVANGGTGVTASSGANSVMLRDANQNVAINSITEGFVNVAAAGTTTVLTASSAPNYCVTGSGGQTYQLPDATTLAAGTNYFFNNNQSSGTIVVKNNSSTTVATIQSGGYVEVLLLSNSIAAGSWDVHNYAPSNVVWSTNTFDYPGSITSATWNGNAVAINRGGTGQTTANAAFNALAPSQTGNSGKYLTTDGSNTSWATNPLGTVTSVAATVPSFLSISGSPITTSGTLAFGLSGTALPTTSGGTGLTSFTANGVVYASSTSALATGSALTFDGTNFSIGGTSDPFGRFYTRSVGITSSGSSVLEISGTSYGAIDMGTGATRYFSLLGNNTDAIIGTLNGAIPLEFQINGSEQMRLTSTGLGIGTSSPAYKLDVQGATGSTISGIYDTAASGSSIAISRLRTTGTGRGYWDIRTGNTASGLTGALDFFDNIAGASRVTFDNAGNVGIGTSSPLSKLDVRAANATMGNYQTIQAFSTDTATVDYGGGISLGGYYSGTSSIAQFASISGRKENGTAGNYAGYLQFGTNSQATGVREVMRLDSAGNLGLGVTPSAWRTDASTKALQIGYGSFFTQVAGAYFTHLTSNSYQPSSGSNTYVANGYATEYLQTGGQHQWQIAPSGTAGNAITFTQAMTLDASGSLLVGTTSAPSNIGLSTKFKTSNGIQYGDSQRTVFANPGTKTFTVTGGGNGSGTYFAIEASQYNGYVSAYFYCVNASGIWTVNQVSRGTSGTAPTITITNNNSATVTVAVAVNGSYSGGFITIDMSINYVSVA
jgi:hypothetical protein